MSRRSSAHAVVLVASFTLILLAAAGSGPSAQSPRPIGTRAPGSDVELRGDHGTVEDSTIAGSHTFASARTVEGGTAFARAAEPRSSAGTLLTGTYSREAVVAALQPLAGWRPFPPAADRAAWDGLLGEPLNQSRKAWVVASAEKQLGQPWPALPATLYMEFARNGNRTNYETPYFARRERLATLVLAECFEYRGRFLDEIANGMWAISEEATWCLPAHSARITGDVLQRQDRESVDLFAAETAMTLATARYLLEAELEKLSPALADRVGREVLRRVVNPVATSDEFGSSWWLDGRNNWSPWCASNVLGAAMFVLDDQARLASLTYKMMEVADRFIDRYGDDGGCDEGPAYWNEAGGALLTLLELLHARSGGAIDVYDRPKIAAIGAFIVNAHIAGPWFVSFSDADARTVPHPGKVYRYGERTGLPALRELALSTVAAWKAGESADPPLVMSGTSRAMTGPLMELFWIPAGARPAGVPLPATVWMPNIQMLVARESPELAGRGLFLSARGGHNDESHNHNDVGNIVVFLDGQPGIIDVGRETYTAQTFSGRRYDLWFTRGSAHNAPVVNGVEQKEGRDFQATGVTFADSGRSQRLSMDLERAYPPEAGLKSLRREIDIQRGAAMTIDMRDTVSMAAGAANLRYTFYTVGKTVQEAPGRLIVDCGSRTLVVLVQPATARATVESVDLADPIMRKNWGPRLHRVVIEVPGAGAVSFRITAATADATR
jgi:hypothetical protein